MYMYVCIIYQGEMSGGKCPIQNGRVNCPGGIVRGGTVLHSKEAGAEGGRRFQRVGPITEKDNHNATNEVGSLQYIILRRSLHSMTSTHFHSVVEESKLNSSLKHLRT